MFYPLLKSIRQKKLLTDSFGGIDLNPKIPEGMFSDMSDMSADSFPLLKSRSPRATWTARLKGDSSEYPGLPVPGHGITAVCDAGDTLCFCTDSFVSAGGKLINGVNLNTDVSSRSMVPFGKNIFIAPEGEYIVLSGETPEVLHGNSEYLCAGNTEVYFSLIDGSEIHPDYFTSFPENPENGKILLIRDRSNMSLVKYNDGEESFYGNCYVGIKGNGISEGFSPGDSLILSGCDSLLPEGRYQVEAVLTDILILGGVLNSEGIADGLFIERSVPRLDFVCEHNNRLWGCRYGKDNEGNFVNEIYASALGEPLKWYDFRGISTDSYAVSLGCSGEFTGAAALNNEVIFFKENYIIRITGNTPSDFTVDAIPARGVEKGEHLSIVNLNEKLFYKNRTGIMVYDGALPVNISDSLGTVHFTDSAAGRFCNKYYIAMTSPEGERSIFVFNTRTSQWYRESDSLNTRFMVNHKGCLYFVLLKRKFELMGLPFSQYFIQIHDFLYAPVADNIFTSGEETEEYIYSYEKEDKVLWYAETGKNGYDGDGEKSVVRRLEINFTLAENSYFSVSILPEGESEWKRICYIDTPCDKVFSVPVNTPPCSNYRLRFEGKGEFILYSLTAYLQAKGKENYYGH